MKNSEIQNRDNKSKSEKPLAKFASSSNNQTIKSSKFQINQKKWTLLITFIEASSCEIFWLILGSKLLFIIICCLYRQRDSNTNEKFVKFVAVKSFKLGSWLFWKTTAINGISPLITGNPQFKNPLSQAMEETYIKLPQNPAKFLPKIQTFHKTSRRP
jgi:hypothetical protein